MADPTLASLDARLAVIENRLGITPGPVPPPPPPPPGPVLLPPAMPTGLRATTMPDGRIQLDWDLATDATSWDVLDLLNTVQPVKDTVTVPHSIRSALAPGAKRSYVVRARNAAGPSLLSAPLSLPAATTPTPPPVPAPGGVNYPADLVGKNWYLTIPVTNPATGWAQEIKQPTLATYDSKYFLLTDDHTGAIFRVWHGGATTSGSKNPRSELREENGAAHASWSTIIGRHRMVVEGQVNRLTQVRPDLVIGQIHSATDDVTVFRVEGTNLWITNGNDPHGYLLDGNFALGRRYQIGFDVSGGVISFLYSGRVVPFTVVNPSPSNYFKAGAYLQSNPDTAPGESVTEYAEAVIYSAVVTHS